MGLNDELVRARNVAVDPLKPENWKDVLRRVDSETPEDVAHRGLKRAEEALRVIEEYTRAYYPQQAEELAKLRYRAYELEQWLVCVSPAMQVVRAATVYVLLTQSLCANGNVLETAKAVLSAGVRLIQLREKQLADTEVLSLLETLQKMCADFGAVLCCNDRLDLALLAHCEGVHLGQDDLNPAQARKLSGERIILGRSTHSVAQARTAVNEEGADYIAIGSMFETRTKEKPFIAGLKLAEEIAALKLDVPVFAIGGITVEKIKDLKSVGIRRVAVSQSIIGSASPKLEAQRFLEAMAA